jgi:hypothetical protein
MSFAAKINGEFGAIDEERNGTDNGLDALLLGSWRTKQALDCPRFPSAFPSILAFLYLVCAGNKSTLQPD